MNALDNFIKKISELKTEKELKTFFIAIFTPKELDQIPKRLEIIRLLKKGISQQEISKKLKVGIATVTRGSRELKVGHFKNVKS